MGLTSRLGTRVGSSSLSASSSLLAARWGESRREEEGSSCSLSIPGLRGTGIPGLRGTVANLPAPVSSSSDGCQILLSMGESGGETAGLVAGLAGGVRARLVAGLVGVGGEGRGGGRGGGR